LRKKAAAKDTPTRLNEISALTKIDKEIDKFEK
jgi:hypothetical protein